VCQFIIIGNFHIHSLQFVGKKTQFKTKSNGFALIMTAFEI